MNDNNIGVIDYIIFGCTLGFSSLIGIYFGCFGKKQKSAQQYLYADKDLSAIPVGLSLYSSAISAVATIGQPSEIYVFGTQLTTGILGAIISLLIIWYCILPVFCGNLDASSPYEYFEMRFDKRIKLLASIIYASFMLCYLPVVLYASTLTVSNVTGIPLIVCTCLVGGVCIFYTMLGGIKSVIWTDTIQATVMLLTFIVVVIVGVGHVGNLSDVWNIANQGGRIQFFNMDPNPFVRTSFWSTVIGFAFMMSSHCGTSASALQRYMCMKSETQAKISSFIGIAAYSLMLILCCFLGLTIYANFAGCDPIKNKEIQNANELVPYFITEISKSIPGLTGLFTAGLLCAALSTLSSELNVTSALIYYDIILEIFKNKIKKKRDIFIMRLIVIVTGLILLASIPLLQKSKYIFQLVLSVGGFAYGARLGMLLIGTVCPMANSEGVIVGTLTSVAVLIWISIGAMYYNVSADYALPTSIEKCSNVSLALNESMRIIPDMVKENSDIPVIYQFSFCYYTLLGTAIVLIVGILVSYLTGSRKNNTVDPKLLAPFLRSYVQN